MIDLASPASLSHSGIFAISPLAKQVAFKRRLLRFNDLMAQALDQKAYLDRPETRQDHIHKRARWAISDHMPAWIRLPRPKA